MPGSTRVFSVVVALLVLVFGLACGDWAAERDRNARQVVAGSTRDATSPVVDDGYKFRIDWPGEGWKLLGPADARRLTPDAVAGAMFGTDTMVVVIIEEFKGVTLDAFAGIVAEGISAEEVEGEPIATVTFAGKDARRLASIVTVDGLRFRRINTVFVHDDHGYQIVGWGPPDSFAAEDLEPLWSAFSILPGDVVGPAPPESKDSAGVGWRVADGVFESAVTGLRVQSEAEWRLIVGTELTKMNPDAEVGLQSSAAGAYVVVISERIGAADARAFAPTVLGNLALSLGPGAEGAWKAEVFGETLPFTRFEKEPFVYLMGVRVVGDYGYQVLAWYPATMRSEALASLPAALSRITLLDPATHDAVRSELAAGPDPQASVGQTHSLRNGVYREFEAGLVWRKPAGFWRLGAEHRGEGAALQDVMSFQSLETGVNGGIAIERRPGVDEAAWHAERVAQEGGSVVERGTMPLANGEARITRIALRNGDLRLESTIGTVVHGDWAIGVTAIGSEQSMRDAEAEIRAVFAGLELAEDVPATTRAGGEYLDHRFGFALSPPSGWTFEDETPDDQASNSTILVWRDGRKEVRAMAVGLGTSAFEWDFTGAIVEQALRDQFSKFGTSEEAEATLGGLPARRATWTRLFEHIDAVLLSNAGREFALIGTNLGESDLAAVVESFRLLP